MPVLIEGKTLEQLFKEIIDNIDDEVGKGEVRVILGNIEEILTDIPEEERGAALREALFKAVLKLHNPKWVI